MHPSCPSVRGGVRVLGWGEANALGIDIVDGVVALEEALAVDEVEATNVADAAELGIDVSIHNPVQRREIQTSATMR